MGEIDIEKILKKVGIMLASSIYSFLWNSGSEDKVCGGYHNIDIDIMEDASIKIKRRIEWSNLTDEEKKQLLSFVKETKKKAYPKAINKKIEDMEEYIKSEPQLLLDCYNDAKRYIENAFKKGLISEKEKNQLSKKLEETKKYLPACLKALLSLARDNTLANQVYFLLKATRCAAILEVDISKDEEEIKASIIKQMKKKVRDEVYCTIFGPQETITIDVSKIAEYLNGRTTFFIGIDVVQAKEIGINKKEIVLSEIKKFVEEEIKKDENIKRWSKEHEEYEIIEICEKLGLEKEAEELRAKFEEIRKAEAKREHKEKLKTLSKAMVERTTPTIRKTTLTQTPKKINSKPIT